MPDSANHVLHLSPSRMALARDAQLRRRSRRADPLVPCGVELDLWEGAALVSMVGFLFLDCRVLGVPVPFHRNFEEVNLRFYVRRKAGGEWRRGVVFIREIVPRRAIALVAR